MGGELGVRWAKPPGLGHGVQGGSGGTRGVQGALLPGLQVHGSPTGVRGLAPGLVG